MIHPTLSLTGSHLRTYQKIFRHPLAHNLNWHDVRALLERLGEVTDEANGNLRVSRNGQTQVFQSPRTKEVSSADELMSLRHFLQRSETPPPESPAIPAPWLVVINHHEARIFRTVMHGAVPRQILPLRPEDHFRASAAAREFSRGREKPDPVNFFGPVARALKEAREILIMGSGKGGGSAMEQFVAWVSAHHPELARQIIGTVVVDQHRLTTAQLLAKAMEYYPKHFSRAES